VRSSRSKAYYLYHIVICLSAPAVAQGDCSIAAHECGIPRLTAWDQRSRRVSRQRRRPSQYLPPLPAKPLFHSADRRQCQNRCGKVRVRTRFAGYHISAMVASNARPINCGSTFWARSSRGVSHSSGIPVSVTSNSQLSAARCKGQLLIC
jgi:hypothetical protein